MCSSIDPAANALSLRNHINEAAGQGAEILFTPEMTGLVDRDRGRAKSNIRQEQDDLVLQEARDSAARKKIWVAIGSLAIRLDADDEAKWVNRSFLIDPAGQISARYDKIHLFDVDLDTGETWRESAAYQGGSEAIVAPVGNATIGLSICYDLRFPTLYAALTDAGADILSIPAAFTVPTGKAHWEILLRARAIEAGVFVVAAAQSGLHQDGRATYGHSMVISPWGHALLDMGSNPGVGFCDIDLADIGEIRNRIPAISNRRSFTSPKASS
ncbi:carbon-nitrogen hydrolase family protein [Parasphingorhabdus cellanae]|uniref:Carbon-nitrogen hydrolase family protein n=2 Tax=Parasphingorhabdus cellanae TaxID=2806553 RepID=A0ABX7TAX9_9SPHN|nr:carbon-nitrogen hydrolase family protein [Parasphingorhabdus cellanae]